MNIKEAVKAIQPEVIAWRRHFHKHAELSFEEYETSDYIEARLKELGNVEILRPLKTGVIGIIRGGHPGKMVALRADIDALPMDEITDLEFKSVNPGAMHSCGHDGHTAMLLGIAKLFSERADKMHGDLMCIFQHAEELPPGGAIEIVEAGVLEGVDEIFGMHLTSVFPTGTFGVRTGVLTSATDRFDIKVIGKGGHSSMPEITIDPVVTGAQIITGLQNIKSRRVAALDPLVFSVCTVHSGDMYNIIPGEMEISGSVRSFSKETRKNMPIWIEEIATSIANSNGCKAECSYLEGYASVINDEKLTDIAREVIADWHGEDAILNIDMLMPGEDFSAMTELTGIPGCFVEIGTRNEEKGTTINHHNPAYLMDEDGLYYGTTFFAGMVARELELED